MKHSKLSASKVKTDTEYELKAYKDVRQTLVMF